MILSHKSVSQAVLAFSLIILIMVGYWASAQILQGAEERFHSAVGLEREKEQTEPERILPIEVENMPLYLILVLATAAFGFLTYLYTERRHGK
jgi:hypothetical protein